jgi:hypothetical protein
VSTKPLLILPLLIAGCGAQPMDDSGEAFATGGGGTGLKPCTIYTPPGTRCYAGPPPYSGPPVNNIVVDPQETKATVYFGTPYGPQPASITVGNFSNISAIGVFKDVNPNAVDHAVDVTGLQPCTQYRVGIDLNGGEAAYTTFFSAPLQANNVQWATGLSADKHTATLTVTYQTPVGVQTDVSITITGTTAPNTKVSVGQTATLGDAAPAVAHSVTFTGMPGEVSYSLAIHPHSTTACSGYSTTFTTPATCDQTGNCPAIAVSMVGFRIDPATGQTMTSGQLPSQPYINPKEQVQLQWTATAMGFTCPPANWKTSLVGTTLSGKQVYRRTQLPTSGSVKVQPSEETNYTFTATCTAPSHTASSGVVDAKVAAPSSPSTCVPVCFSVVNASLGQCFTEAYCPPDSTGLESYEQKSNPNSTVDTIPCSEMQTACAD